MGDGYAVAWPVTWWKLNQIPSLHVHYLQRTLYLTVSTTYNIKKIQLIAQRK